MLSVLVQGDLVDQTVELIFKETSTLGVRRRAIRRHEADRQIVKVDTSLGKVPPFVSHNIIHLAPLS